MMLKTIESHVSAMNRKIVDSPYVFLFVICVVANWLFITNNFLYWDDWVWVGNTFNEYFSISKMLGRLPIEGFYMAFIYILPPFVVKLCITILIYLNAILLYKINESVGFEKLNNLFITLLFMLNPIIGTKHSLCIAPYYISLFEFSLASFLLICKFQKKYFRLIALVLFFTSFSFNALLCFYAVPFMYIFYKEVLKDTQVEIKTIWRFMKKYFIFLLMPFVFFVIKIFFLKPSGPYAQDGYNSINLNYILGLPKLIWLNFINCFTYSFGIKELFVPNIFIFILLFGIVVYKKLYKNYLFVFIVLSFVFSVLPYIMVGKSGNLNIIEDRHFFLVLYPIALVVFFCIKKIFIDFRIAKIVFIFIISCYVWGNLRIGYNFYKGKLICESFIQNIKQNETIRDGKVFAFCENIDVSFFYDSLENYNLFGLFWKAFGDETRVAFNVKCEDESYLKHYYSIKNNLPYKIKDIELVDQKFLINFEVRKENFGKKKVLKAYLLDIFKHSQYIDYVSSLSSVSLNDYYPAELQ